MLVENVTSAFSQFVEIARPPDVDGSGLILLLGVDNFGLIDFFRLVEIARLPGVDGSGLILLLGVDNSGLIDGCV